MNGSAGALTFGNIQLAGFNNSIGTINANAGSITATNNFIVGGGQNSVSTLGGRLNVDGGTVNATNLLVGAGTFAANFGIVTITSGAINAGTITLSTDARSNPTAAGQGVATMNLNGGTVTADRINRVATTILTGSGTINFGGGTLRANSTNASFMTGLTAANVNNGGVTVDTNGFDITIGQALLHGTGATTDQVTKSGAGALTLTGANTYTGGTEINGGKLTVSSTGDINSTSGVSIGTGEFNYNSTSALTKTVSFSGTSGTLSGTGTITPEVVITSGNRQTAGTSVTSINTTTTVGSQTFTNGITYNANSIFEWNLNANNDVGIGTRGIDYDSVNTLGLNTTDTKAIFRVILNGTDNFDETFWDTDRTWANIFTGLDGSSALNIAAVFKTSVEYFNSAGLVTNANATRSFTLSGTSLVWSAVPEPATTTLACLLLTAGLLRRRR